MSRLAVLPFLIGALILSACATMTVSSHMQPGLNFAQYRTFDWGPADALPTGDPRLDNNPFFKDHLQGAVEKGLLARGLERASGDRPQLLIHYHASITQRIDVDRADRNYGYCYGENCAPTVTEYEAGTIVLDFVDSRTNRVIWRGWAQDVVDGVLDDQEALERRVHDAVRRMLARLPIPEAADSAR